MKLEPIDVDEIENKKLIEETLKKVTQVKRNLI